jgi:urease accessory protein
VALAIHFAAQGLSARDAFVVHQYGVAATILGAALRLMRISHVDTQSLLFQLNADVDIPYATAAQATLDDMAGFLRHGGYPRSRPRQAHVRLFMN